MSISAKPETSLYMKGNKNHVQYKYVNCGLSTIGRSFLSLFFRSLLI